MYWNKAENSCTYLVHGSYDSEVSDPHVGVNLADVEILAGLYILVFSRDHVILKH